MNKFKKVATVALAGLMCTGALAFGGCAQKQEEGSDATGKLAEAAEKLAEEAVQGAVEQADVDGFEDWTYEEWSAADQDVKLSISDKVVDILMTADGANYEELKAMAEEDEALKTQMDNSVESMEEAIEDYLKTNTESNIGVMLDESLAILNVQQEEMSQLARDGSEEIKDVEVEESESTEEVTAD